MFLYIKNCISTFSVQERLNIVCDTCRCFPLWIKIWGYQKTFIVLLFKFKKCLNEHQAFLQRERERARARVYRHKLSNANQASCMHGIRDIYNVYLVCPSLIVYSKIRLFCGVGLYVWMQGVSLTAAIRSNQQQQLMNMSTKLHNIFIAFQFVFYAHCPYSFNVGMNFQL